MTSLIEGLKAEVARLNLGTEYPNGWGMIRFEALAKAIEDWGQLEKELFPEILSLAKEHGIEDKLLCWFGTSEFSVCVLARDDALATLANLEKLPDSSNSEEAIKVIQITQW
ncbi:hypothetical protein [Floridanema evergladense]|uniref:Uncharacterized protein n=1 Tax=Floridaenema evergladense BLCC-F167 TaxID=3153639 RepID=A0ABV4WR94_9CYAN